MNQQVAINKSAVEMFRLTSIVEKPFSEMSDVKWLEYSKRPMNFEDFPVYVSVSFEEIINLEKMIRNAGYIIALRTTVNSCNIPIVIYNKDVPNWRQETTYCCFCKRSMATLGITFYESFEKVNDEIKPYVAVYVDFCDYFKQGGRRSCNFPSLSYIAGGLSIISPSYIKASYFTAGGQRRRLSETITPELLAICSSKNMYKTHETIPTHKSLSIINFYHYAIVIDSFEDMAKDDMIRRLISKSIVIKRVESIYNNNSIEFVGSEFCKTILGHVYSHFPWIETRKIYPINGNPIEYTSLEEKYIEIMREVCKYLIGEKNTLDEDLISQLINEILN